MFGAFLMLAMRQPFEDPRWYRKILIGGLLNALPGFGLLSGNVALLAALFVPSLIGWGYVYAVFIGGLNGRQPLVLPDWGAWRRYLTVGLWLFLIVLGYILIMAVFLLAVASILGIDPVAIDPDAGDTQQKAGFFLVAMVTMSAVYAFFPIAFARFAEEGRVWTAFDPWALWHDVRTLVTWDYVQGCFLFYGFFLGGNILFGLIPQLGLLLFSFFFFYMVVVFAHIFGFWIGRRKEAQVAVLEEDEEDEE